MVLLDGKAVSDAGVQFWPDEDLSLGVYYGKTDASGKFELQDRSGKWIKPGNYLVLVAKDVKPDGRVPDPKEDQMLLARPGALRNALPPRYFDRANPLFRTNVVPGHNELPPFELTAP
jgi:hypothetical protein